MPTPIYPSWNDKEYDLLKKMTENTALIADYEIGDVASVAGTANQLLVNGGTAAATGNITLSLPSTLIAPGNLTVNGTGTTGGNLRVRNALGYATGIHTGTTSDSTQQLLLSSNAAYNHAYISKGSTTLGIGFSSDNGSFVADDSITITAATKLVALTGNLTVNGTGTSSFSGPLTVSPGAIGGGYLNLNKDGADLYLETQRWTGVGSNFGATRITGSTSGGGFLTFSTSNETTIGAQTFTERMRLTSTGNVGIGTTSPSAKFVVSDGGANGLEVNPNASGRVLAESYSRSGATYVPFRLLSSTTIFNDTGGNVLIGTTTDAGGKLQIATGASNTLLIGNDATYTSYNQISLNGTRTNSGVLGMIGGGAGDSQLYLLAPTGGALLFQIAASTRFRVNSSGDGLFTGSVYAEKAGAGIAGQSTGSITQFTTVNSTTYSVTTAAAKVFVVQLGSGDAALCYTSYKSSTITILGSDGTIVNSNSPSSTQLGIWKGANDHVIYFVTGSNALAGSYGSWGFCFLGNPIISIA